MPIPKWKYQKIKTRPENLYIRFEERNIPKKMKITEWQFLKKDPNDALFKTCVIEEDGLPVDKFWTVWDYDLKEKLKKMLKPFKHPDRTKVTVIIELKGEEMEEFFEASLVKE